MIIENPQLLLGEASRDLYEFFFSACTKPVDKQKRICNRNLKTSQLAVARSCKRSDAGFVLPSIIDGGSPATAMLGAVCLQFLAPATRGLEAFGWRVLKPEQGLRWVEWRA